MTSRGINKVILIGHLGQNPEVRYMSNGSAVANITLATSENWKDKNTNELREKVEWHRVVLFGKLAEIASKYLKKGSQVYIEGSLQTKKWRDQNGLDRYNTEIIVNMNGKMYMLGNRSDNLNNERLSNQDNKRHNKDLKITDSTEDNLKNKLLEEDMSNIEFDEELPF